MKNAIISILATKILMDGSCWEFNGFEDRAIVTVMVCLVLFTLLQCFESFYKDQRREAIRRRRKLQEFQEEIDEILNDRAV